MARPGPVAHLAAVDEAEAGRHAGVDQPCHACLSPPICPGRRNHRSPGRRLIAGYDDSVKRSLTAGIMARAREIVLVMGREDNSPMRMRCGEIPKRAQIHYQQRCSWGMSGIVTGECLR